MAAQLAAPYRLWLIPAALLSAAVGLLAGIDPKFAIAAAFAVALLLVALGNLGAALTAFTLLTFLELTPSIGGPAVSFAKAAGLIIALAWVVHVSAGDHREGGLFFSAHPVLSALLGLFLAWALFSVLWSESASQVTESIFRYGLNFALFPIVFTGVRTRQNAFWIAGAFTAGAALAAAYGLFAPPNVSSAAYGPGQASELNRIAGTVGDPNLFASILVIGLVFAVSTTIDRGRATATRVAAGTAAALCLTAVVATGSRGGLFALGGAAVAAILFGGRRRAGIAVAAAMAAVAVAIYFSALAPDSARERVTTADGGTGRTDIWRVGWRMVEDEPLRGIGSGNFSTSSIHYLLIEPGAIQRDQFFVDVPAVAHNVYLEILAELGIVGLALFCSILVATFALGVRAAQLFARAGDTRMEVLTRAVLVAMGSVLVADVFLSAQFIKQAWLLFALCPALLRIAQESDRGEAVAPGRAGR